MRDRLTSLLEAADLALGSAANVIAEDRLQPVMEAVRAVRTRLSYPDDMLVVAFAGGTGSGKSSLFNAVAGQDLVDVGGVRPTTSRPAAVVPADAGPALDGYLDHLGIEERHTYPGHGLCLLDMPDTDSVEVDNRHRVDAILPLVDVVVWVVDPEKYRDARLHDDYLKPLSPYSAQFVFALNQIDRLSADDVDDLLSDLEVALDEDWLDEPTIVALAAAPPSGPPIGLDGLMDVLESKRKSRSALYGKLLTDLELVSQALGSETGTSLDFDRRAIETVSRAAADLGQGEVGPAISAVTGFLDDLAGESGGPTAERLEALAAEAPAHVKRISAGLRPASPPPRRRWFSRRTSQDAGPARGPTDVEQQLSEAVIRPARAILAKRAMAVASVAELGVAVESLRRETPR
ncbi:MAG TPA: GTPase [Acidimicrobiia bacterium]|jgi:GTP-binding protein EngB required for normal cell division|nr:GTPase [Acidimicrobiia bacterium]